MQRKRSWANRLFCLLLVMPVCFCASCEEPSFSCEEGIAYTDALGRRVTLPQRPQRVAALLGSFAQVWVLSGGELCAAPEDAFTQLGIERKDAVSLGGAHSPSAERLTAAAPELVLASASTASHVALRETLESMEIPVVYFDVDGFSDYLSMLRLCTQLTGREDCYETHGTAQEGRIAAAKERVKALLPPEQREILLLRASAGFVKAKGSEGTVLGEMLFDLGCVNLADGDGGLQEELGAEAVLTAEPYRIFAVAMGEDTKKAQERLEQLLGEHPAWASLAAVKEGRVHFMPSELFHQKPNEKWALAYEILADILLESKSN